MTLHPMRLEPLPLHMQICLWIIRLQRNGKRINLKNHLLLQVSSVSCILVMQLKSIYQYILKKINIFILFFKYKNLLFQVYDNNVLLCWNLDTVFLYFRCSCIVLIVVYLKQWFRLMQDEYNPINGFFFFFFLRISNFSWRE